MRVGKLGLSFVVGGLALGCISSALGSSVPITYQVQTRTVSANSTASGFGRGGTDSAPTTDAQSQSQQANGMGVFSGNASVTSTLGPDAATATASAVQQSSLGDNAISASGSVRANSSLGAGDGPASSSAITAFHITFDVAQAQSYSFTANLNGITDPAEPGNTSASIALTDAAGNNVFAPIATVNLVNFQSQGTLMAGVYKLTLDAQVASDDQSNNFVNYNLAFSTGDVPLTQLDGAVMPISTGPVAVPLPAAAPSALLMLAGLGLAGYARSHSPRAARDSAS